MMTDRQRSRAKYERASTTSLRRRRTKAKASAGQDLYWVALLAIFFVCGPQVIFLQLGGQERRSRVGNVVGSGTEASRIASGSDVSGGLGNVKYSIFIPEGKTFTEREIEIKKGMVEEDIEKVLSVYIDGLKETQMLDNGSRVLNVFRSGDWLYLDMTGACGTSLKTRGKDQASRVITGLVRTMADNFPPIKKVKFYIDGKESVKRPPWISQSHRR